MRLDHSPSKQIGSHPSSVGVNVDILGLFCLFRLSFLDGISSNRCFLRLFLRIVCDTQSRIHQKGGSKKKLQQLVSAIRFNNRISRYKKSSIISIAIQPDSLLTNKMISLQCDEVFSGSQHQLDQTSAFLTSDNLVRSNEIFRTKWPIY